MPRLVGDRLRLNAAAWEHRLGPEDLVHEGADAVVTRLRSDQSSPLVEVRDQVSTIFLPHPLGDTIAWARTRPEVQVAMLALVLWVHVPEIVAGAASVVQAR